MHHNTEPVVAIVVAAGSGSRLGATLPKALVELDGTSLVRRCVDNLALAGVEQVVVTIPEGYQSQFDAALEDVRVDVFCVVGGARRQDSVRLGLQALSTTDPDTIVLVHDAARPLVPAGVVGRVVGAIRSGARAVVPTLPVVDSIREVTNGTSVVVERSRLRTVQTPQGFRLGALINAHRHVDDHGIEVTDDAGACEAHGVPVVLVEGHRHGLKITEPIDLLLAGAILATEGPG
ncbi:2-C-methyl-D-erythritol 4-phosphate cytidylyltransferase [Tessaracoccus sp.]